MSQSLPPFLLMQTIESVTRLNSLKRAAEEMSVTPSAVSHRVRLVEEQFGQRLFVRDGQGIRPTESARRIAAAVAQAMTMVEDCWRELTDRPETRRVRLSAMSAFAEQFILSNLVEFRRRFPDFQVTSTSLSVAEGGMRGDYDVLIGIGTYPDEGWEYEDIMPLKVKPVYSPETTNPVVADNVVLGPILQFSTDFVSWENAAHELGFTIDPAAKRLQFDSVLTACQAAARGNGIVLAPAWSADKLILSGEVVALGDREMETDIQYWIAVRKSRKLDSTYGRFRRWLDYAIGRAE